MADNDSQVNSDGTDPLTPQITGKELKAAISVIPDNAGVTFQGLTFYRADPKGKDLWQIEFNESFRISRFDGAEKPEPNLANEALARLQASQQSKREIASDLQ